MHKYQQDEESSLTATCDSFTYHEITSEQDLQGEKEIRVIDYDRYLERQLIFRNNKNGEPLNLEKSLSRTLNKLTKNKSSVELILEVEMVKPRYTKNFSNKKSNSLVEVTVIHTDDSDNLRNKKLQRKTFPFREIKNSESETGSMKRRKWFDRIINNQVQKSTNEEKCDKRNRNTAEGDHIHNITNKFHEQSKIKQPFTKNNMMNNNINSANRNTLQPQKQLLHENEKCLANQVIPKRKVKKKHISYEKTRKHKTDFEKKLSFSKNNEIHKIEKALDSLKNEINSKIDIQNKHSPETKGYVCNLGKVVNNILTDLIEKPESHGTQNDKDTVDTYFEAVLSNSKLINDKNKTTGESLNKGYPNLTEAMQKNTDRNVLNKCMKKNGFSGPDNNKALDIKEVSASGVKNTLLTSKYIKSTESQIEPSRKDAKVQVETLHISDVDTNKLMNSKLFKMVNSEFTSKEHIQKFCNKSKFTVRSNMSHHNLVSRKKCYRKTKTKLNKHGNISNTSHEYLWMWDGKKFGICFDLKKRIETLIIKELQNLALKKSFEYSISQISDNLKLPEPSNSVTFLCHLDVNDKKIKRISRTLNKNCTEYKPKHLATELNTTEKSNIHGKCVYTELTLSQHNTTTLNTTTCKDASAELTATKEHTHLVPYVQFVSKVNTENRIYDGGPPKTTKNLNVSENCLPNSAHLEENCDYNSTQLAELPVKKTYKYPLPDIKSTCSSKLNQITDTKLTVHKYPAEKMETVHIKYFNMNWTPESDNTSNHSVNISTKEGQLSRGDLVENENTVETNFCKQNQLVGVTENEIKMKKIRNVKEEPKSDESLWNGIKKIFQKNINFDQTLQKQIPQKTINTCTYSEGTHNTQSTVEIELDLKNFKSILEKTKRNKHKKDKVSENKSRKHKRNVPSVNSDEYTKSLLIETGKKLEEYLKGKEQQKMKKRKTGIKLN